MWTPRTFNAKNGITFQENDCGNSSTLTANSTNYALAIEMHSQQKVISLLRAPTDLIKILPQGLRVTTPILERSFALFTICVIDQELCHILGLDPRNTDSAACGSGLVSELTLPELTLPQLTLPELTTPELSLLGVVASVHESCFYPRELLLSTRAASIHESCFYPRELLLSTRAASIHESCFYLCQLPSK